jgi:hypothetical protein
MKNHSEIIQEENSKILRNATIPLVITILSGLLKYFAGTLDLEISEQLQYVVYTAGALALIWLFMIAISAKMKFGTTYQLNRPHGFWRLVYNKIPTKREKEYKDIIDIALIYDSTLKISLDVINSIEHKFSSHNIRIQKFDFNNESDKTFSDFLFKREDPIDAIYFLLTDKLSDNKNFVPIIEEWGIKNDDKPIMYVDYSEFSNENITYGKVSKNEADNGLWRLLARSAQRSRMWKKQATVNRRYFFGVFIFIVSFLIFNYILFQNQRRKDFLELNKSKLFLDNVTKFNFANYQSYSENLCDLLINKDNKSLSEILKFYLKEIQYSLDFPKGQNCLLSIWKQKGDSIYRLARSDNDGISVFPLNTESITGISFENLNDFILWKKKSLLNKNEVLIWDENGHPLYFWDNEDYSDNVITCLPLNKKDKKIILTYNIRKNQFKQDEDKRRAALLCLAMTVNDSDKYGVCMEFDTLPKEIIPSKLLQKQLLTVLSNAVIIRDYENLNYKKNK